LISINHICWICVNKDLLAGNLQSATTSIGSHACSTALRSIKRHKAKLKLKSLSWNLVLLFLAWKRCQ